jgi:Methyltransferase domain
MAHNPFKMRKTKWRQLAEQHGFASVLYNLPRLAKGYQPIFLDYPVDSVPRYGHGRPAHPELTAILSSNDERYRHILSGFLRFDEELLRIPTRAPDSSPHPSWINKWFAGLDTFALYGFIAERNPSLYVEVGSGASTRIVRQAIRDHNLRTRIYSIDPHPRAEIDSLCDKVVREPLEQSDLLFVSDLHAGDILFIDGSHRSFMNSDVTVFFLEILPRLRRGVIVHIHDIYLPLDYQPERAHWFYSEQYMLAASLLAGHRNYEILLPNFYIGLTESVCQVLDDFWKHCDFTNQPLRGCSFWIEIT